jgi:putative membrane protein
LSPQNKFIGTLAAICGAVFIWAAIEPFDRQAWALENILLVIFVVTLSLTHRRLQLSNASYLCIAYFIILHLIGAHYTYERMPLGNWAKNYFHLSRNYYDRFAHGAFGFFLAYPIRELLLKHGRIRWTWSFWLATGVILAVSGFFEILESIVAEMVAPGQGVNWLAGQGDEWDAQNDMLSAFIGALLMMATVAFAEWKRKGAMNSSYTRSPRDESVSPRRPNKIDIHFLPVALAGYVIFWIALAIHPVDRKDWLLENLLVFITAAVFVFTYRRFQLSNWSYALILIFLAVHTIGAHYTYAKVPAGFWLQHWLGLSRNHYDRVIHFAFGFFLVYPMRELLQRCAGAPQVGATWLAVSALAALSSFFEILEAVIAQIVAPDLGTAYLGTQGDIWDAQEDMTAAFVGALLTAAMLSIAQRRRPSQ